MIDEDAPTIDAFIDAILTALELDQSRDDLDGSSHLEGDAELDSLDRYEILCTVEEWAGCEFDDQLIATWATFDDIYRCYVNNRVHAADKGLPQRQIRSPKRESWG